MARTGESYQAAERVIARAARPVPSRSLDPTATAADAAPPAEPPPRPADPDAALIGSVLAGRYRLLRIVPPPASRLAAEDSRASPWVTYEAHHVLLGGLCDVRRLPAAIAQEQPHLRAWLLREGRALRRAEHPAVPRVFDIAEEDREVFLVLEPLSRTTLADRLERGPMHPALVLDVVRQLAQVLEHLHARGVVHGAVRNGAICLDERRADRIEVKLTSFALARLSGEPRLAPPGAVYGHPAWMSPEQCRGDQIDGRSDLYALGVVLYTMLASRLPFDAATRVALLELHCTAPPPPIRARGEPASPLDAVCARLLAKDPAARFASATELLAHLPASGPSAAA